MIVKEKSNSNTDGSKSKPEAPEITDLYHPSNYLNRELSLLQFNLQVLEEAQDVRNPLLERVKFLAIFANNLDEFFMIRVSGLIRQIMAGVLNTPPDGMKLLEQLMPFIIN